VPCSRPSIGHPEGSQWRHTFVMVEAGTVEVEVTVVPGADVVSTL
jgi:hypothetical protein